MRSATPSGHPTRGRGGDRRRRHPARRPAPGRRPHPAAGLADGVAVRGGPDLLRLAEPVPPFRHRERRSPRPAEATWRSCHAVGPVRDRLAPHGPRRAARLHGESTAMSDHQPPSGTPEYLESGPGAHAPRLHAPGRAGGSVAPPTSHAVGGRDRRRPAAGRWRGRLGRDVVLPAGRAARRGAPCLDPGLRERRPRPQRQPEDRRLQDAQQVPRLQGRGRREQHRRRAAQDRPGLRLRPRL